MTPIAWYSVIPKIEEARDKQDWFNAIVLSAIQLERHGYIKIKKHLESLKLKYRKDNLKNLSLPDIALFLLALKCMHAVNSFTLLPRLYSFNTKSNNLEVEPLHACMHRE